MRFSAAPHSANDQRPTVRDQTNAFILSRLRVGLRLLVVANVLISAVDLVSRPANLLSPLVVRGMFTGLVIALLRVARLRWASAHAVPLAVLAVAMVSAQLVVFAGLRGDAIDRAVLIVAFGASTCLVAPWGMPAQLITNTIASVGALIMLWSPTGGFDTLPVYPVAATGIAFAMSMYGAHVFKRSFARSLELEIERQHAEAALAKLNTELEQRVQGRTRELAAANAQLSALVEHTNDAIWSIDRAYRLTGFNSVVRQWLFNVHGKPLKLGETFDVPEEERDYWRPLYDRALAGERIVLERVYPIADELRSFLISMTPIITEGEVDGVTVYAKDITALRRAEECVRQHQAELAHVLRVNTVGEMAAGLAHEINQPLGAIANYAQGCRRRIASGSAAEALLPAIDEIAGQALRAGEIIRRLRLLVQKGRTRHEEVDLNAIVADAVHVIEPQARHEGVTLSVELASGLPRVAADQIQVAQVVLNLMLNALEAMQTSNGAGRELSVRTRSGVDGTVEVTVRDTGIGLTDAISERMFEPFFTSKPSGLGLGLAISRSIIEEHGGRLWATNNADHGATFYVALPAARRAQVLAT